MICLAAFCCNAFIRHICQSRICTTLPMSSHLALLVDMQQLAASTVAMHICCIHGSSKCNSPCAATARIPCLQAPQSYRLSKVMQFGNRHLIHKEYIKSSHAVQIQKGLWYDANGKRAIITQYHEVIGSLLGMWAQIIVQIVIIISLVGTSFAQIVACASDVYYYDSSKTKREW